MLFEFSALLLTFPSIRLASSQLTTSHRTTAESEAPDFRRRSARDDAAPHYARLMLCTTTYPNAASMAEASAGAYAGADPYGTTSLGPAGCFVGEPGVGTPTLTTSSSTSSATSSPKSSLISSTSSSTSSNSSSTTMRVMTTAKMTSPAISHTFISATVSAASSNGTIFSDGSASSHHRKKFTGIVCGGLAAGILAAGVLWFTGRRWKSWTRGSRHSIREQWDEKHLSDHDSTFSPGTSVNPDGSNCSGSGSLNKLCASKHIFRDHKPDERHSISPSASPTAPRSVEDLDLGITQVTEYERTHYTIVNPDPTLATTWGGLERSGLVLLGADNPLTDRALTALSTISSEANSLIPNNQSSHLDDSTYNPCPPPTKYRYFACRPPCADSPERAWNALPRTPPENRLLNGQESTTDTCHGSNSTTDLYRGLNKNSRYSSPPWAYMSPEEAISGGWRNLTPPNEMTG